MSKLAMTFVAVLLLTGAARGTTLLVPSQYPTIQAAINAAINGDTVLVADGTYTGPGNKDLDFLGKAILVTSENGAQTCIINCQNSGRGFYFHSGEDFSSVLSRFSITNGSAAGGGGIRCSSSPTITNCIITQCTANAENGGGIMFDGGSNACVTHCSINYNTALGGGGFSLENDAAPRIDSCFIHNNTASGSGGIWCFSYNDGLSISNSTITGNIATHWAGGGITYFVGGGTLSNCLISENTALLGGGGGIWCDVDADVLITHCIISENRTEAVYGAGIVCEMGSATLEYCTISGNAASTVGGGLRSYWSDLVLSFCTFAENSAGTDGGGIYCIGCLTMRNCTISQNTASGNGGGILYVGSYDPDLDIMNSIISGNTGNGGLFFESSLIIQISYSDFYGNQGGNFTGSVPGQLGQIVGMNVNGDPCDVFQNIFEDPLFADPGGGNFQITWANYPIPDSTRSPCIDAGHPNSPLDPDGTIADMGAFYFDQSPIPPIQITLIPPTPPIIIPAIGGMFQYNVMLTNSDTSSAHTFNVWIMTRLPNGIWHGPLFGPLALTLVGGGSLTRTRLQHVPGNAPAGEYWYEGRVGNYPAVIWDTSGFAFTKAGSGDWSLGAGDWSNTGDSFEIANDKFLIPNSSFIISVRPNPFNPETVISYNVPDAGNVSLTVYDLTGRLVTTLVNGWRQAGRHEVMFDASNLPSGIYLDRLEAGESQAVGKMVLMK